MKQTALGLMLLGLVLNGLVTPALGEQDGLRVIRVEIETEDKEDNGSPRDYYIDGGKNNGLETSMILNVFRPKTIPDYDRATTYSIKIFVGQLKVMKIFDNTAIARIHTIAPALKQPVVTYRTVMVGDYVVPPGKHLAAYKKPTAMNDERPGPMLPLSMNIPFDFDRWNLTNDAQEVLTSVIDKFYALESYDLILEGHTCSMGSDKYNQELSMKRVRTVEDFLMAQGIANTRIHIGFYGEKIPAFPNTSALNKKTNRRVEVSFADSGSIPSPADSSPAAKPSK